MVYLEILTYVALGVLAPFSLYLGALGIASFGRRKSESLTSTQAEARKLLILIPAHNESSIIASTLEGLKSIHYEGKHDTLVIADNCTDDTAQICRDMNVNVWERSHPTDRSKGFALDWAINKLHKQPDLSYDAIVIIDADTLVAPDILTIFNRYLQNGCDWIQGLYSGSNKEASWRTRVLCYAFSLINGVYLKGSNSLGLSCALRGNGMCFSMDALKRVPCKAATLAEDLEFSWVLRMKGEFVTFAHDAKVFGELVSQNNSGAVTQRQRWEDGRRLLKKMFTMQIKDHKKLSISKKLIYFIDLYMPPIVPIVTGLLVASVLGLMVLFLDPETHVMIPFLLTALTGSIFFYGISPIVNGFAKVSDLLSLVHAPKYMLWKAALIFKKSSTAWHRTPREEQSS